MLRVLSGEGGVFARGVRGASSKVQERPIFLLVHQYLTLVSIG